jgi:hypothetical protein
MTRTPLRRFRRSLMLGGGLLAAAALTLGTAAAASAATTWGGPTPTPTPTVHYTPPPRHHKPPPPVQHCFLSLETEHDTLAGQPVQGQGYAPPTYTDAFFGGQPQGYPQQKGQPTIEVVQLVKVCVTTQKGHPDVVQVWDETGPFAWEDPASGPAPTPTGLPSDIAGMLAA